MEYREIYPLIAILEFYQWMCQNRDSLVGLGPSGTKTEYKNLHGNGRGGGSRTLQPIDHRVTELWIDFEAAVNRQNWAEATPLYYRLKRVINY